MKLFKKRNVIIRSLLVITSFLIFFSLQIALLSFAYENTENNNYPLIPATENNRQEILTTDLIGLMDLLSERGFADDDITEIINAITVRDDLDSETKEELIANLTTYIDKFIQGAKEKKLDINEIITRNVHFIIKNNHAAGILDRLTEPGAIESIINLIEIFKNAGLNNEEIGEIINNITKRTNAGTLTNKLIKLTETFIDSAGKETDLLKQMITRILGESNPVEASVEITRYINALSKKVNKEPLIDLLKKTLAKTEKLSELAEALANLTGVLIFKEETVVKILDKTLQETNSISKANELMWKTVMGIMSGVIEFNKKLQAEAKTRQSIQRVSEKANKIDKKTINHARDISVRIRNDAVKIRNAVRKKLQEGREIIQDVERWWSNRFNSHKPLRRF